MVQAHIFYSGMVQGVGFRYSVERIAGEIGQLSGWVRNVDDGRVEILVEGERSNIEQLISSIEKHFNGYIRNKVLSYGPAEGTFKGFQITH